MPPYSMPKNEQKGAGQLFDPVKFGRVGRNGLVNQARSAQYLASCFHGFSYHSSLIVMT
jgi:hypothetical protein